MSSFSGALSALSKSLDLSIMKRVCKADNHLLKSLTCFWILLECRLALPYTCSQFGPMGHSKQGSGGGGVWGGGLGLCGGGSGPSGWAERCPGCHPPDRSDLSVQR